MILIVESGGVFLLFLRQFHRSNESIVRVFGNLKRRLFRKRNALVYLCHQFIFTDQQNERFRSFIKLDRNCRGVFLSYIQWTQ